MPSYIALLRKDPDSDYGVEFPDFPGWVTAAKIWRKPGVWQRKLWPFILKACWRTERRYPSPAGLSKSWPIR
jgi:hypothetical protein